MNFDLSAEEQAFELEVEKFLEERRSPEAMDPLGEQLSQQVDWSEGSSRSRARLRQLG